MQPALLLHHLFVKYFLYEYICIIAYCIASGSLRFATIADEVYLSGYKPRSSSTVNNDIYLLKYFFCGMGDELDIRHNLLLFYSNLFFFSTLFSFPG